MNNYMKVIINGLKQWVNNMLTVLDEKLTKRIDDVATRQDDMVKSVNNTLPDENGNVQVTADYEQSNPEAADYIKNRPFYTGDPVETEIFDINAATGEGWYKYSDVDDSQVIWKTYFWVPSPMYLEEGRTYSITINGERFTAEAQLHFYRTYPVLGDLEAYNNEDYANLNYVFFLYEDGQKGFVVYKGAADTPPTGECKLYTDIIEINRIDPKYLPEGGVGYDETLPEKIVMEEQTVSIGERLQSQLSEALTFEVGKTYIATFNGEEYRLTAWDFWYDDGHHVIYIGDGDIRDKEGMGEDAPFLCSSSYGGVCALHTAEPGDYTIQIRTAEEVVARQIDKKYIPTIQPDWNENSSESKHYIKNRPLYEDYEPGDVIFEESTIYTDSSYRYGYYGYVYSSFEIEAGKSYFVTLNGTSYKCVAWDFVTSERGLVVLGNDSLAETPVIGSGEDVPFVIAPDNGILYLYVPEEGAYSLEIAESISVVHKIDEKFLPIFQKEKQEGLETIFEEQTFEIEDHITISDALVFKEGKTYVITFNGEQYSCIAWYNISWGNIIIGNGSLIGVNDMGEDVPFACSVRHDGYLSLFCELYVAEAGTHTIKIKRSDLVNKIDPKYLPNTIDEKIIPDTIARVSDIPSLNDLATQAYADSAAAAVKNDLLNGAGEAYDTLKELADLIDENTDAVDALEQVAAAKADSIHLHSIGDIINLQSTLDAKASASNVYTKAEVDAIELISVDDIDALWGTTIELTNTEGVTF